MSVVNPHIFRKYDVRGIVDEDLTEPFARLLGQAYGTFIVRAGGSTVALGRDCRLHSERLAAAFENGVASTGLEVVRVGVVPSPLLYFAVHYLDLDGGVQITGSHNPPEYNGFKMMTGKHSLWGQDIQRLRGLIEGDDFEDGVGALVDHGIEDAYVDDVVGRIALGDRKLRIVVDGGNGTGGPVCMRVLERLGVAATGLYIPMDGHFPNHHPDPTVEANIAELKERVVAQGADFGVAFDGDADRIGVIDERGQVMWGDKLLIVLARALLAEEPGAAIVGEVKCSKTLYDAISAAGGRPIMSKVGHSIIKTRMKKEGALLAGEMSGHIFYAHNWYGFDDAVYATARLLEIVSRQRGPLSGLLSGVAETSVTPEIRLDVDEEAKFGLVQAALTHFRAEPDVQEVVDIDGARVEFEDGWGLIRASNTQPVLVLRAEAATEARRDAIRERLEGFLAEATR